MEFDSTAIWLNTRMRIPSLQGSLQSPCPPTGAAQLPPAQYYKQAYDQAGQPWSTTQFGGHQ